MLILTRADIASLLQLNDCIPAVESAFRSYYEGKSLQPGVLSIHADDGSFHIKAAGLKLTRIYVAVKTNGNFPENPTRNHLPTIQGAILLCDGENGSVLAVMDSIEITIQRTAAATAVAAKYLARKDSHVATICGCGVQGSIQLAALTEVLPIHKAFAYDIDPEKARRFSSETSAKLGIPIETVTALETGTLQSDVVVTCTTSRSPFLGLHHLKTGAFVAAVGADSPAKSEIQSDLLASAKIVTDITSQCAEIGDLKHAIETNVLKPDAVYSELGEIVALAKAGRTSADEVFIFDSTGSAIQDVAAAAILYERAIESGKGLRIQI